MYRAGTGHILCSPLTSLPATVTGNYSLIMHYSFMPARVTSPMCGIRHIQHHMSSVITRVSTEHGKKPLFDLESIKVCHCMHLCQVIDTGLCKCTRRRNALIHYLCRMLFDMILKHKHRYRYYLANLRRD